MTSSSAHSSSSPPPVASVRGVTHKYTHGTGGNQTGGFVTILDVARNAEKP
jgi:hypothetical protein